MGASEGGENRPDAVRGAIPSTPQFELGKKTDGGGADSNIGATPRRRRTQEIGEVDPDGRVDTS